MLNCIIFVGDKSIPFLVILLKVSKLEVVPLSYQEDSSAAFLNLRISFTMPGRFFKYD